MGNVARKQQLRGRSQKLDYAAETPFSFKFSQIASGARKPAAKVKRAQKEVKVELLLKETPKVAQADEILEPFLQEEKSGRLIQRITEARKPGREPGSFNIHDKFTEKFHQEIQAQTTAMKQLHYHFKQQSQI